MALTPPIVDFFQFNTSEIADPSGTRHISGGSFAFQQRLSTGCRKSTGNTSSGTLVFENLIFDATAPRSHLESKVTALVIRTATSGVALSNLRLFLGTATALNYPIDRGLDPAFIQIAPSGSWQPNSLLPSGAGTRLTAIPGFLPNVKRQDGENALIANDDANVSQYIYMNLVIPYGGAFGQFGACGSGQLQIKLLFDFFDCMYRL